MTRYGIIITKTVQKQLDKLPNTIADDLIHYIKALADDPRPSGYKKLKGRQGYRVRKGEYRIIYDIFDKTLLIKINCIIHEGLRSESM